MWQIINMLPVYMARYVLVAESRVASPAGNCLVVARDTLLVALSTAPHTYLDTPLHSPNL